MNICLSIIGLKYKYLKQMRGNKLKNRIRFIFIMALISMIITNSHANETSYQIKRVPAEWELQEAI